MRDRSSKAPPPAVPGGSSVVEGNFYPYDTALAVGQNSDMIVAFIETAGVDFSGTLSLLISPSQPGDTVVATLTAFGRLVGEDGSGEWSYSHEGNGLRIHYTGRIDGAQGIRGYLSSAYGSGFAVDTGERYLRTTTGQRLRIEDGNALADQNQYVWTMEYATDAQDGVTTCGR